MLRPGTLYASLRNPLTSDEDNSQNPEPPLNSPWLAPPVAGA